MKRRHRMNVISQPSKFSSIWYNKISFFLFQVQQLREEESSLRQENLQLKEELLRLNNSTGGIRQPVTNKYSPAVQTPNNPMLYMVLSVALAVFGFILGKFILWAVYLCIDYTVASNLSNLLYIYYYYFQLLSDDMTYCQV